MRPLLGILAAFLVLAPAAGADAVRTFDEDPLGAPPPAFTFAAGRGAVVGRWTVERDGTNRFVTHAADVNGGSGFSLAILDAQTSKDLAISARLKFVGGKREGGLVWRYQDPGNFYMARLDLSDREMAIYRVVHGNRIRLEGTDDLDLDVSAWHALRVRHEDRRIRAYLGGVKVFDTTDRTFRDAGGVGLWASGESAISFDDFRVDER
jgi:hypothetical protein